jgi:hypothetical protein
MAKQKMTLRDLSPKDRNLLENLRRLPVFPRGVFVNFIRTLTKMKKADKEHVEAFVALVGKLVRQQGKELTTAKRELRKAKRDAQHERPVESSRTESGQ